MILGCSHSAQHLFQQWDTVIFRDRYYLVVIREIDHLIHTVMVPERPTRHIAPARALTKQPDKLSFGDAGSFSSIEFGQ
jgi:hypothetical protein